MPSSKTFRARLGVVAAGAALAASLTAPGHALARGGCGPVNAEPNTISLAQARSSTLCLLNRIRRAHHLRPFRRNGDLSLASQRHAKSMAVHHFFAHGDFVGRIRAAHYLKHTHGWTLGENIAWGTFAYSTPASIVAGWMHSPPHRANILNRGFREIGLGVSRGVPVPGEGSGGTYVTDFGTRY
jgi:uncharacterized protein YkwD